MYWNVINRPKIESIYKLETFGTKNGLYRFIESTYGIEIWIKELKKQRLKFENENYTERKTTMQNWQWFDHTETLYGFILLKTPSFNLEIFCFKSTTYICIQINELHVYGVKSTPLISESTLLCVQVESILFSISILQRRDEIFSLRFEKYRFQRF